jgi:DNA-binding IclR family transcriptional regulator
VNQVRNIGHRPGRRERSVPAVDRAVLVLRAVSAAGAGLRLADLSRQLGLSKSSLSDLLLTLEGHGLVERDPASRTFHLGHTLVELGMAARGGLDLARAARPALLALRDLMAETAILHIPAGPEPLILDSAESPHQLKVVAPVGHRLPPLAGSVAKVFLAALPDDERRAAVTAATLPCFTPRAETDPDVYLAELERVRRSGYATDDEEYLLGVRAVSAPVLDNARHTVGTLTLVGAGSRFTRTRLRAAAPELVAAARDVSRRLGAEARLPAGAAEGWRQ